MTEQSELSPPNIILMDDRGTSIDIYSGSGSGTLIGHLIYRVTDSSSIPTGQSSEDIRQYIVSGLSSGLLGYDRNPS